MKVLLTGASGFIGSRVGRVLDAAGADWAAFQGNALNPDDFAPYRDCGVVIHLAARVRGFEPMDMVRQNIQSTMNALCFSSEGGRRAVLASSYLYGAPASLPISEDAPTGYHSPYAFSKWQGEQAARAWNQLFGLTGVVFRLFNVYGPGQPEGFLISDIMAGAARGSLELLELASRRDFIYVDDAAELIAKGALAQGDGLDFVNAASGESHSVAEVVELIFELLGRRLPVKDQGRPVSIADTRADISRARALYDWRPAHSLRQGLAKVLGAEGLA